MTRKTSNQKQHPRAYSHSINYRLPNDSIPLRYELWIKTDVDKADFAFSGVAKIHIKIVTSTKQITLHFRQIDIKKVDFFSSKGKLIESNLAFTTDSVLEFLTISLPFKVTANDEIILDIIYTGMLRSDQAGFYRASYQNEANSTIWFAATQFQSTDARHAMPCYDEPAIRAVMSLRILHGKGYEAISNMPIASKTEIEGSDYVITKFRDTPPMQTYLLAFVVSNFKYKSSSDKRIKQRIYAKPQSILDGEADFAASAVGPVLRKYEKFLGVSYPLRKLDHVSFADFGFGAMENFGLIVYRDKYFLSNPKCRPKELEKTIIGFISHEIAHQFFGNIVSPTWWSHIWLNEGFANFFEHFIPSLMYPEDDFMDRSKYLRDFCFMTDVGDAKPLNFYIESPVEIETNFQSVSYDKAAVIVEMFQEALTVPTFTKGLRYYLTEMFYKAASPSDLHRNLQKAYDEDFRGNSLDIGRAMSTWEDQAGYPTVTVRRINDKFVLTQQRVGGRDEIYAIPIFYSSDICNSMLWMTSKSVELRLDQADNWIILNVRSGYYKVIYDAKSLRPKILPKIPANHRSKLFENLHRPKDSIGNRIAHKSIYRKKKLHFKLH